MDINVNVRISADEGLTQVLTDLAAVLARNSISKINPPVEATVKSQKAVEKPKSQEKPPKEKQPKAEEKHQEEPATPEEPAADDDPVVDAKELPKVREAVNEYCKKVGVTEGKQLVKKWLNDNGYGGLGKLTYSGMNDFLDFLAADINRKEGESVA